MPTVVVLQGLQALRTYYRDCPSRRTFGWAVTRRHKARWVIQSGCPKMAREQRKIQNSIMKAGIRLGIQFAQPAQRREAGHKTEFPSSGDGESLQAVQASSHRIAGYRERSAPVVRPDQR